MLIKISVPQYLVYCKKEVFYIPPMNMKQLYISLSIVFVFGSVPFDYVYRVGFSNDKQIEE